MELMFLEVLKDFSNMLNVFLGGAVGIDNHEIFAKSIVNIPLKRSGGIAEAKEYDEVFQVIVSSAEHCFPFVAFGYT
jgi:hypothetical protein